jgi:predicted nucleic acid-binding protein
MSDKRTFIDSNVILYLYADEKKRKKIVMSLLTSDYIISTQVVSENVNVCLKKLKLTREEAYAHGKNLLDTFRIVNIYPSTITSAFSLSIKYGFSYWDSLIVAAALENDCEILFSEDMQDGLLVEGKLKLKNPFRNYNS